MKHHLLTALVAGVLALTVSMPQAQATEKSTAGAKAKKEKKTAAPKKASSKFKFLPSGGESAAERATRLKRECKGRVNAGACEGYTG